MGSLTDDNYESKTGNDLDGKKMGRKKQKRKWKGSKLEMPEGRGRQI